MPNDLCSWPRCREPSGIVYAALRTKTGTSVSVNLCDKHWGVIAEKGPVKAALILKEKIPGLTRVDPYYNQQAVVAPTLAGEELPPEKQLFDPADDDEDDASTFDDWGAGGGFDDG